MDEEDDDDDLASEPEGKPDAGTFVKDQRA